MYLKNCYGIYQDEVYEVYGGKFAPYMVITIPDKYRYLINFNCWLLLSLLAQNYLFSLIIEFMNVFNIIW